MDFCQFVVISLKKSNYFLSKIQTQQVLTKTLKNVNIYSKIFWGEKHFLYHVYREIWALSNMKIFQNKQEQMTSIFKTCKYNYLKFPKSSLNIRLQCRFKFYFAEMIVSWLCTQLVNRLLIKNLKWPPW